MNKIIIASCILLAVGGNAYAAASGAVTPLNVEGGTINFTGNIVDAPCAVDNDSDGQLVRLGQYPVSQLTKTGSTSGDVAFSIKLDSCNLNSGKDSGDPEQTVAFTSAKVTFSGSTIADNNDKLSLTGTGSGGAAGEGSTVAQGVGIQILEGGKALKLDGSESSASHTLKDGDGNVIDFAARYISTSDTPVAGQANGSVTFSLTYE